MSKLIDSLFKNFKKSLLVTKPKKINIKFSKTPSIRKVIIIDPLTLQPIRGSMSLPSKGHFKKFIPAIQKHTKPRIRESKLKRLPKCPEGKIRNSITGKCRKIKLKKTTKVCPENKILKRGRCVRTLEDKLIADKKRLSKLWLKHQFKLVKQIKEDALLKKEKKEWNLIKKIKKIELS